MSVFDLWPSCVTALKVKLFLAIWKKWFFNYVFIDLSTAMLCSSGKFVQILETLCQKGLLDSETTIES
jgi:hypothetical protein